jgi:hypothetical protein
MIRTLCIIHLRGQLLSMSSQMGNLWNKLRATWLYMVPVSYSGFERKVEVFNGSPLIFSSFFNSL